MERIGIGIAGFGTVGAGVYKNLQANADLLAERLQVVFDVRKIGIKDPTKNRNAPSHLFTTDLDELIADPEIRVVVELIGGIDGAHAFAAKALAGGKIVVTGNKAMLAERGQSLFQLAREKRVPIFYEAAVAGGIPIIKAIRESFVANHFESIHAIINGTSNYILSRMTESGMDFPVALKEAQEGGYAEADPSLDVNGWDAAHKAIILAGLAYGFWIAPEQVRVEGIERVTAEDVRFAGELGYRIKLLATIRIAEGSEVELRVVPTLIPERHVLASVEGVFNAILVKGDVVGESLFYGRGAGSNPTASSVLADLADSAMAITGPRRCYGFTCHDLYGGKVRPPESVASPYYLRLSVDDQPGVLAQVAGILGTRQIGISSVIQPETHDPGAVPLVLMIHEASFGAMSSAVEEISRLACVKAQPALIEVQAFS